MIFCRFSDGEEPKYGIVDSHKVQEISPHPFASYEAVGDPLPIGGVQFLAPVVPSKIVCVGVNYRKHAQEMKHEIPSEPIIFLKPPTCVIGPDETILYPKMSERVDYEGELAIII